MGNDIEGMKLQLQLLQAQRAEATQGALFGCCIGPLLLGLALLLLAAAGLFSGGR